MKDDRCKGGTKVSVTKRRELGMQKTATAEEQMSRGRVEDSAVANNKKKRVAKAKGSVGRSTHSTRKRERDGKERIRTGKGG